jgi:Fe-S cluster biogenesis protein NfuA
MNVIEKDSIMEQVELALDSIRPFLKSDGGDVELLSLEDDMTVLIRLLGNCKSCQMSEMTMRAGVEEAIRKAVPVVKAVTAVQ